MTRPPIGKSDVIAPRLHKHMETATPFMLMALPWLVGFAKDTVGRNFFLASALVVGLTRLMSQYEPAERKEVQFA
jgi:hypothetical protein